VVILRVAIDNINIKGNELMKIFGWEILWKSIFYYGHWKVRKIKDIESHKKILVQNIKGIRNE